MTAVDRRRGRTGFLGFIFGRQSDYVRRLTPMFLICLAGFCFSLWAGFQLGDSVSMEVLEEVMGSLPNLENFDLTMIFLFIIFNNVIKSFMWMVLGALGGFPPLFFAVLNGFFLGSFSYSTSIDYSLAFTAAAIIPHGIIEIPTILLSSAAGMALGYALINRLRGRGSLRAEFRSATRLFVSKIVPLLIISAVIEVTLTPMIVVFLGLA
jgi:stage II sporulation protein M